MKIKVGGWEQFFKKKLSPELIEKIKAQLSEEDRNELFSKKVLPISWVEYKATINFIVALDRIAGKGDFTLMHETIKELTKSNIDAFSKLVFRVASPDFLIPKSFQLWKQYYNEGHMEIVEHEHGRRIVTRLVGVSNLPRHYEQDLVATYEAMMEMVGVKSYSVKHTPCTDPAEGNCLFEITWSK